MKKKACSLFAVAIITTAMAGCGQQPAVAPPVTEAEEKPAVSEPAEAPEPEPVTTEAAASHDEIYASEYGWIVHYDPTLIRVEDNTDPADEISFIYTGESGGTNCLTVSWTDGELPDEFIEELKDVNDTITVEGNIFPGTSDKWGYWVNIDDSVDGLETHEEFILAEYSNGTLCFQFITQKSGDDEIDIPVSDALAMIIDSVEYENFGPQNMYEGLPGTYTQTITEEMQGEEVTSEYSLVLNEDHTGLLNAQDVIPILWDDKMIRAEDGGFFYNYTKNGGTITVDMDGIDSIFTNGEGGLPAYEYPGPEAFYSVLYSYVVDELSQNYDKTDVSIPSIVEVSIDDSDKDDIKYYGDFWIFNYDLDGDTLMMKSGGNYPGMIHIKQTDSGYEVTGIDLVEDGSSFEPSAKKIFGDQYDAFMEIYSDDKLQNEVRAQIIANYVAANNLPIKAYQDYGQDPTALPEENIDTFYSDL